LVGTIDGDDDIDAALIDDGAHELTGRERDVVVVRFTACQLAIDDRLA
jgi:hypothetical protein